ncbi:8-oxoguanine DNA glycosylase OGG fold protein [Arthrobacter bambusae]
MTRATVPPVPPNLRTRFQNWDAKGRQPQQSFKWKKENWRRYLGSYVVLDDLANPIDRAAVTEWFKRIHDPASALDAYIASYLWGYARVGFGPYRAARVIRLNTDPENEKDFKGELRTLARIATEEGGLAAFQHVVDERARSRRFFRQWGPAFATKFISFATMTSPAVDTTTIMDSIVSRWFAEHCREIGPSG